MELRDWLHAKKWTMERFGAKIGQAQSIISRLCNDKHKPRVETIQKIVAVTNGEVTANDLCKIPKKYWR